MSTLIYEAHVCSSFNIKRYGMIGFLQRDLTKDHLRILPVDELFKMRHRISNILHRMGEEVDSPRFKNPASCRVMQTRVESLLEKQSKITEVIHRKGR